MIEPVTSPVADEPAVSGVSWPSILAGAAVSMAITLVLIAFGTGLGLSVVSPWSGASLSGTTFKIATGLYLIVIAMLSSSIGGYLAGRLRTKWTGVHTDEVYFRDTAHGFLAWAVATVVGVVLLATPVTSITASGVAGGAAATAGATSRATDFAIDQLLRPNSPTSDTSSGDARAELTRLLGTTFQTGDLSAADRSYVDKVIAARTGLSEQDADKRLTDTITAAKNAAETARKNTIQLAFWLTAALLIGAFSASLAATEGGGLRDGTWKNRR
ncbi:MAG: hypothetical protein CFE29_03100 [Bradyrhizobiaceae bacterium PARB1]|jgi:hypothetical protein|nr:MAG: hypothetical protein CFE29_03100 [Bradyrhizobiaceae bacterium PARB1]